MFGTFGTPGIVEFAPPGAVAAPGVAAPGTVVPPGTTDVAAPGVAGTVDGPGTSPWIAWTPAPTGPDVIAPVPGLPGVP
jgi:hypothetical protein